MPSTMGPPSRVSRRPPQQNALGCRALTFFAVVLLGAVAAVAGQQQAAAESGEVYALREQLRRVQQENAEVCTCFISRRTSLWGESRMCLNVVYAMLGDMPRVRACVWVPTAPALAFCACSLRGRSTASTLKPGLPGS